MMKLTENIDEHRNNLKEYFLSVAPNTNVEELTELVNEFTLCKFSKNQLVYKVDDISDTFYFLVKGLVRAYYLKEDKEITNVFIPEKKIVAGAYSILTGEKNYSNYEAFEETYALEIKYVVLESYYRKYHSLERLGRLLVQAYYCAFMKKTFDVLFLSAEERYQLFLRDNGDLLNRVPLKHIASYLGITQETLSRLRSKH